MRILSAFVLGGLFLISCGNSQTKSAARLQAESVHETLIATSADLHHNLADNLARAEAGIDALMAAGDTAQALVLARVESQLSALDVRFHDWSETMVEIPGHAHSHGDHSGHDHSGHDHSGHDHDAHAGHDHDHHHAHGGPSLEGLSDDEILSIQLALQEQLDALVAQHETLASDLAHFQDVLPQPHEGHDHGSHDHGDHDHHDHEH
jgi:hypothetical protein